MGKGRVWFVVILMDYFIKWAKAKPLATITEEKMESFVEWNIISIFGIPRVLIRD